MASNRSERQFRLLPDTEPRPLTYWLGDEPEHDIATALGLPRGSVSITEVSVAGQKVCSIELSIEIAEVTE